MKTKGLRLLSLLVLALIALSLFGCKKTATDPTLDFSDLTFTDYMVFDAPRKSLRALSASADGTALYAGHIQLGTNGIRKLDIATASCLYVVHDGSLSPTGYLEYPKGLATDDRGNVYAIISTSNSSSVTLLIMKDLDGSVISETKIEIGQADIGANGIAVHKYGTTYRACFITNYGANRIYGYDVTDPSLPVPDSSFGVAGIVNLEKRTGVSGADANYLAFTADGSLLVTIKLADGSKADAVGKFSADGKTFTKFLSCPEAYGITIAGRYLFVSTYQAANSVVNVYTLSDAQLVATLAGDVTGHGHYSQVVFTGNRLYIADQGYQTGDAANEIGSRILVSSLIPAK